MFFNRERDDGRKGGRMAVIEVSEQARPERSIVLPFAQQQGGREGARRCADSAAARRAPDSRAVQCLMA